MRCPDCAKMVSFSEDSEPEVLSSDVDEDGNVTVEVRVVRCCGECGTELAEAMIEASSSVNVTGHTEDGHDLEVEVDSPEMTERSQTTDRNGKKISNPRYAKRFIGFSVEAVVKCSCGNDEIGRCTLSGDEQASAYESLV